ncbi:uncharacterized protein LOC135818153 isoform X2 [Sycon ciliatum]|uniref:uncharacterized protein LOC135818153 isoform X2 n=1 Tax=Sycon ciliatum TaxID=27933 RepID=UPI0031F68C4F
MQAMADFWYDVIRPIYGLLHHIRLDVQEHKQLVRGFKHPKGLDPNRDPVMVTVTALLDTGTEGGMRLIDVLSRSPQRCNQCIADYLQKTWDLRVRAGPEAVTKDPWCTLFAGVKHEIAELLSTVRPTVLQGVLIEALDRYSCISSEAYSGCAASLLTHGEDKEAVKKSLEEVMDNMLDNGTVASIFGLLALVLGPAVVQHLPLGFYQRLFSKLGFYGVDLRAVFRNRYNQVWPVQVGAPVQFFSEVLIQPATQPLANLPSGHASAIAPSRAVSTPGTGVPLASASEMSSSARATSRPPSQPVPADSQVALAASIGPSPAVNLDAVPKVNLCSTDGESEKETRPERSTSTPPPTATVSTKRRKRRKAKAIKLRATPPECLQGVNTEAYQKALQNGKFAIPHGRLLVCGKGRTGKTCLAMSLLNMLFKVVVDSTLGVELKKAVCTVEQDGDHYAWHIEKDEFHFFCLLAQKLIGDYIRDPNTNSDLSPQRNEATKSAVTSTEDDPAGSATVDTLPAVSSTSSSATEDLEKPVTPEHDKDSDGKSPATIVVEKCRSDQKTSSTDTSPTDGAHRMETHTTSLKDGDSGTEERSRNSSESTVHGLPADADIHYYSNQFLSSISTGFEEKFAELVKKFAFLEIWDFAGQELFAAVQHVLFSALRCAYLVVFDASEPLQDPHVPTMGQDGREIHIPGTAGATNFDILESWLNVISQVIGTQSKASAPLFIIGTKIDKIPAEQRGEKLEEIKHYIRSNARGKFYENCIDAILFVDNTLSGSGEQDKSVVQLRRRIIESLTKQFVYPTPLIWLPASFVLRERAKAEKVSWLSLHDVEIVVRKACEKSPQPVNIKDMLAFYHDLGHLRHYARNTKLADTVFTDVHWLTNVTSLLFCPQPKEDQEKLFREQYDLLAERGILTESLAKLLWKQHGEVEQTQRYTESQEDRDVLFNVMQEFSLLYDTKQIMAIESTGEQTRKFFVPSMVTLMLEKPIELQEAQKSPPIFLCCEERQFFPGTLFWCLLVRCLAHYCPSEDPVLYHNAAQILCYDNFHVIFQHFQRGIRVTVEQQGDAAAMVGCDDEDDGYPRSIPEMCDELLPFLEEELQDLKANGLENLKILKAVICRCSLNKKSCKRHDQPNCHELECVHFIPLIDKKKPRCPRSQVAQDESALADFWPIPMTKKSANTRTVTHTTSLLLDEPTMPGPSCIAALPQQAPEASVCTAEDYRRALRKHYAVVQSSLKVDIIGFAKRLYSEDHITKECIKEVRAMLKADRQVEAADHMYVALEDLTDAGLCFFVEDVLESQGLSELVKTFRSCPGPRKCSLNPESLHHGTTSVKSAPRVVQLRLTATDASTGMHGAEVAAVPAVVSDNGEVRSSSSSDKCEAVMTHLHQIILQQRHLDLKSSLNVEDHILDYMYEKEFISKDLKCKIAEKSSQKDQADCFLTALPGLGSAAFDHFIIALDGSETLVHRDLAQMLRKKVEEKTSE